MKIKKKEWAAPFKTALVCVVPLILYLILKFGEIHVHAEYLWWFFIIMSIYYWFLINFEIIKNKEI